MIISEFIKRGVPVLTPVGDNQPYDLVICYENTFYKIQVKTTEKIVDENYMQFELNKTNPYKKTTCLYSKDEVDYFALYCVENDWCGLIPYNEHSRSLKVRINIPKNNQIKNVIFARDLEFDKQLKKIWGINKISENIVHKEKSPKKRNRKTKICPTCNINYIKPENKQCRSCYLNSIRKQG